MGDGVGSTLCVGDGVGSTLCVGDGVGKHIMCGLWGRKAHYVWVMGE